MNCDDEIEYYRQAVDARLAHMEALVQQCPCGQRRAPREPRDPLAHLTPEQRKAREEWELNGTPWPDDPETESLLKRLANRIKPLLQIAGKQLKRLVGHAR